MNANAVPLFLAFSTRETCIIAQSYMRMINYSITYGTWVYIGNEPDDIPHYSQYGIHPLPPSLKNLSQ